MSDEKKQKGNEEEDIAKYITWALPVAALFTYIGSTVPGLRGLILAAAYFTGSSGVLLRHIAESEGQEALRQPNDTKQESLRQRNDAKPIDSKTNARVAAEEDDDESDILVINMNM